MDCRIFGMHMLSFFMHIHAGDLSLKFQAFVESAQNLTPEKSLGGCKTWHVTVTHPCGNQAWSGLIWLSGMSILSPSLCAVFFSSPVCSCTVAVWWYTVLLYSYYLQSPRLHFKVATLFEREEANYSLSKTFVSRVVCRHCASMQLVNSCRCVLGLRVIGE